MSEGPGPVVIGGSLFGMAVAARLAAVGHRVTLVERQAEFGGRPAADNDAERVEALEPVVLLPAPWRDLFRKTGRTLDLELADRGLAFAPASPVLHTFADGRTLELPAGRAEQHEAITQAFDERTADVWRDLLDRLGDTWQSVRRLGLEKPLSSATDLAAHKGPLWLGRSVADVARMVPSPLSQIVAATAWRVGTDPRRTPAFVAVRLAVERDFGRWFITDTRGHAQAADVLQQLVVDRLHARDVDIRLSTTAVHADEGHVVTSAGTIPASVIVLAASAWRGAVNDVPSRSTSYPRRSTRPDLLPSVEGVSEEVRHTGRGTTVTFRRPHGDDLVTTEIVQHAWRRMGRFAYRTHPARWLALPTRRPRGPWHSVIVDGPAAIDPWVPLLTGALAAYDIHSSLTGEDIRPSNVAYRPRVHRRGR